MRSTILLLFVALSFAHLATAQTVQGTAPREKVAPPKEDNKEEGENESAETALEHAKQKWFRLMQKPNADYFAIQRKFLRYFRKHANEGSGPKEYGASWLKTKLFYLNARGRVQAPPSIDYNRLPKGYPMSVSGVTDTMSGDWRMVGPRNTFTTLALSGTNGGYAYCVRMDPTNPNKLFISFITGGLWVSADNGNSWHLADANMPANAYYDIDVCRAHNSTVYAVSSGAVIKSTDGGMSWRATTLNSTNYSGQGYDIAASPTDSNVVVARWGTNLYRTADGGATWSVIRSGLNTTFNIWDCNINGEILDWDNSNDHTVYLTDRPDNQNYVTVYKSTDAGASFSLLQTLTLPSSANGAVTAWSKVCTATNDTSTVYILIGSGANSSSGIAAQLFKLDIATGTILLQRINMISGANTSYGSTNAFVHGDIAMDIHNENNIVWGCYSQTNAQYSTDNGATFSMSDLSVHFDLRTMFMMDGKVILGTDGSVVLSTDSGNHFTIVSNSISNQELWGFGSAFNSDILAAGCDHGPLAIRDYEAPGGWYQVLGADQGNSDVNPLDSVTVYSNGYDTYHVTRTGIKTFRTSSQQIDPGGIYSYFNTLQFHPNLYHTLITHDAGQYPTSVAQATRDIWKNSLVRSDDNGLTVKVVHTFQNPLFREKMCMSDTNRIYVVVGLANSKLMKTTDGGAIWTDITPASSVTGAGVTNISDLAVSDVNPNEIWVTYSGVQNTCQVLHSTNGGVSYVNLTTATLTSNPVTRIIFQRGTNGGVYVGNVSGIYYRNDNMPDWVLLGNGLPQMDMRFMFINYSKEKILIGTSRGAWDHDLYEHSSTSAQISASTQRPNCQSPLVQFKDYSVVSNKGKAVTYSWSFPGGNPATSTLQNPLVSYAGDSSGLHSVSLTVTDQYGTSTQTLPNFIYCDGTNCPPFVAPKADTVAGNALDLTPAGDPVIALSPMPIKSNTFTITLWTKPRGLQQVFSQIISSNTPNTLFGIGISYPGNYINNLNLTFTSNSVVFWQQSTLNLAADQWNHVALTYTPDSVSIYLNGGAPWTIPAASSSTPSGFPPIDLSEAPVTVNADIHGQGGNYKGQIDEICFYNYALSQEDIREKMHLTRAPGRDSGLVGYYQFNQYNPAIDTLYDAMGHGTASAVSPSNISPSTVPVASGVSYGIPNVNAPGVYAFPGTGLALTFPGPVVPNGEIVVSRLNSLPDSLPALYKSVGNQYWVVRNWGANAGFTALTSARFTGNNIDPIDSTRHHVPALFLRSANEYLDNWTPLCSPATPSSGNTDTAVFGSSCNDTSFGQFFIGMIPSSVCSGGSAAGCPAYDSVPGKAINFYDYTYFNVPVSAPATNTFTVTAWVRPKGIQQIQTGILAWDQGYFYLSQNNDNQLEYLWNSPNAGTAWNSGLFVQPDQWSFVAMVVHPDSTTLYLNDHMSTDATPQGVSPVTNALLGSSNPGFGYYFGLMDEVTVWSRALSTNEIDSLRHLTREKMANRTLPGHDTSLIGYFQFNDTLSSRSYNLVDSALFPFSAGAGKIASTAPVGGGVSAVQFINGPGSYTFGNTGVKLNYPATGAYPNGNIRISKLNLLPDQYPAASIQPGCYWVMDNYGADSVFAPIASVQMDSAIGVPSGNVASPNTFKLFKRPVTAEGYTWGNYITSATAATGGTPGSVTFGTADITSEGQLFINGGVQPPGSFQAPQADTVAGKVLDLTPAGDPVIALSPVPINSNTFTITFWTKPRGLQQVFSQMISSNTPNTLFGIGISYPANYIDNLNLTFTSSSIAFWQQSTLNLAADQWNHVALTYTPDAVSIYLNGGVPWIFPAAYSNTPSGFPPIDLSEAPVTVNADIHNQGANYKGQMDEICFYNYALSQEEIREKMHLTKVPGRDSGLVGYYQFNQYNATIDTLYDAMGNGTASAVSPSNIGPSTVPVASGVSYSIPNVYTPGAYAFPGTGLALTFPGAVVPNGEIVVSRLNSLPDSLPATYEGVGNQYWVVRNWGANASFTALTSAQFTGNNINPTDGTSHQTPTLFIRGANEYLDNWTSLCSPATPSSGNTDTAVFGSSCNVTGFGQFFIGKISSLVTSKKGKDSVQNIHSTVVSPNFGGAGFIRITPNPVNGSQAITIQNVSTSEAHVDFYLSDGRLYGKYLIEPGSSIQVSHLPRGAILYNASTNDGQKASGVEIVL
ncbi:MAG TPA: LamG-like jellyroll fold domain-containing protein [Puia sp.]|nr:LamG-like jellyroll fold domain-containing protein [Puia sp.]